MRWRKLGRIIEPGILPWMVTHAQNPFPERIGDHLYRIHFAGRDEKNRSRGGFAIVDMRTPDRRAEIHPRPCLDLGALGAFDDGGAMPSCLLTVGDRRYLYYTGWTPAVTVPFRFYIGLAVSQDEGETYERLSRAPVVGPTLHDPFLTCSPWVIEEDGRLRMWYVSGSGWEPAPDRKPVHYYNVRHAESADGIDWRTDGTVCIDYSGDEHAFGRPVVRRERDHYGMWYCYRARESAYRAGYAESLDGIHWVRKDDDVGIDVSATGWDSEMICYPCVFEHEGAQYMLYNGNGYGATGAGLAVLERT
jgi:hypothetical protein